MKLRTAFFSAIFLLAATTRLPAQGKVTWQLDKVVSGVEFYHAIQSCNGNNVVFLKMNNKNKYKVKVDWSELFTTQAGADQKGFAGLKTISLAPGETSESVCDTPKNAQLVISAGQVQPTYLAKISKFSFSNIKVARTI